MNKDRIPYLSVLNLTERSRFRMRRASRIDHLMKASGLTAGAICGCLISWQDAADDLLEGQYLKWKDGQSHRITFLTGQGVIVPGQTQDNNNIQFFQWEVTLHEEGRDRKKTLSTSSKGLIRQLLSQDRQKSLQGRTFSIKATGDGKFRRFEVTPVD